MVDRCITNDATASLAGIGEENGTMRQATKAIHSNGYAQNLIDCLTHQDRNARFDGDIGAWYDCFSDLWTALGHGAKVQCVSLGSHTVRCGGQYGRDYDEIRPSKIISSQNPHGAAYEFAIMVSDHTADDGKPPYVMVMYSTRTGNESRRIGL